MWYWNQRNTAESLTSSSDCKDVDNPNIVLPTINASAVPSVEEASQISESIDVTVSNVTAMIPMCPGLLLLILWTLVTMKEMAV